MKHETWTERERRRLRKLSRAADLAPRETIERAKAELAAEPPRTTSFIKAHNTLMMLYLEKDYKLWCPECGEEFTMWGIEAVKLPVQDGGNDGKHVECPKCGKFVAVWGGRPES